MFEVFNLTAFYIISQIFAVLSIIFDLVAAQRRKKVDLLKMDTLAAFCSSLHYVFLGAWSGLASKIITTIRNALAVYQTTHKNKKNKLILIVFVLAYIIMGILTFNSFFSILPILAPSIYTIVIYTSDVKKIRYAVVISNLLWLIYDIHLLSIAGILAETIIIINGLVAIYRYRKKNK